MVMLFEDMLRLFFGNKAYGSEGWANNKTERKKEFLKIIKFLVKNIVRIDATERQKKRLMIQLEQLGESIKRNEEDGVIILRFFMLIGILFGYGSGYNFYSLCYFQNEDQHYTEKAFLQNEDFINRKEDQKDAFSIREGIVKELISKGYNSFKISIIFNISEYEVKKILSENLQTHS